ncbi:right-handed parallel beta-helix repeat-containing protein [bacterium]|nr:right-handed parallel beta-helix repeat-containing protein [bacterium]
MKRAFMMGLVILGSMMGKELWAETYVSGTLSANITWNLVGSPYIATDTVTVAQGVILTIEPGVTMRFATETSLICYGTLNAVGILNGTITFTSDQATHTAGHWNGIRLSGNGATGSKISYCDIEYAEQAVYLENVSNVEVTYNIIKENKGDNGSAGYSGKVGAGIYLLESNNNIISTNTVFNNTGGQGGQATWWGGSGAVGGVGCGIYLHSSPGNEITGNTIFGNRGGQGGIAGGGGGGDGSGGIGCGIYLYQSNNGIISGNIISQNTGGRGGTGAWASGGVGGIGYGIYLHSSTGNKILNNTILNNQGGQGGAGGRDSNGGTGGIGCGAYLHSSTGNEFSDNTILSNTGGQGGSGGGSWGGSGAPGQGYGIYSYSNSFPTIHYNNLFGNKKGDGTKGYGVCHDGSSGTISATYNWWGDASGPSGIGPGNGDMVSSYVDYNPWLTGTFTGPSIAVTPTSGLIGTSIIVKGFGFELNNIISLSFGTHQTITTTQSNSNGTFSCTFIVDAQPPCTKIVTVHTQEEEATAIFLLAPTSVITFLSPVSGPIGTLVTIAGQLCQGSITIGFGTNPNIASTSGDNYGFFSTIFIVDSQPPCTKVITASGSCCVGNVYATTIFFLAPSPQITLVSPISGLVGTIVTIAGQGFGPNTEITIDFGTNLSISVSISSLNGTFMATFIVDTQAPCTKTITALSDSCIGEVFATTLFKLIGIPGISLIKTGATETLTLSTITYTLAYQNTGQTLLSGLILTDTLPDGSTQTFTITTLPPGGSGTITLDYYVTESASKTITNQASIEGFSAVLRQPLLPLHPVQHISLASQAYLLSNLHHLQPHQGLF